MGMPTRELAGRNVPAIGLGTWQMEYDGRNRSVAALRRGIELGMTHIDTAEMYGDGEVERIVADAIEGRRDEVFLVSKVLPTNASRPGTIDACEQSLKRLRTDHLDLYLLHWVGAHPIADTVAAFEQLVEQGKIRAYGVSNFDVDELEEAAAAAGDALACNQVLYHLQQRSVEHRVLPWCEKNGVPMVAYSPLGQGFFPAEGVGGGALEEIATTHGASRFQVALSFLLRHPSVFVIPKAATLEHVEANARAADIELSPAEIARLEEAFPLGQDHRLPTL